MLAFLRAVKTSGHNVVESPDGFTLVELLVVVALIGILSAIAGTYLLAAKVAANEASAIGTVRSVNSGQNVFRSVCGSGFYAVSLATLVAGEYLNPDANLSPKSGFTFTLGPGDGVAGTPDCSGQATRTGYYFAASPLTLTTGRRGLATNQFGTIWQDSAGNAPVEPFPSAPTVSPIQ